MQGTTPLKSSGADEHQPDQEVMQTTRRQLRARTISSTVGNNLVLYPHGDFLEILIIVKACV